MNRNSVTATEMGQSYRYETDSDADDANDIDNDNDDENDSENEHDMAETDNQGDDTATTATAATAATTTTATSSGLTSSLHKRPHDDTDTKVTLHYKYLLRYYYVSSVLSDGIMTVCSECECEVSFTCCKSHAVL
jgi:hypothetical protein